jgi:peptide chain release factor subunit 1
MALLDRTLVRKLAEWTPGDLSITSMHLSVDGRRYPRKQDYEVRLDELIRRARERGGRLSRDARRSLEGDLSRMETFVKEEFERGPIRGVAMFSCSGAGLWEEVLVSRPFRDKVEVGPQADLLSLETLLETYESFCTVLVDSEKARIFLAELGRIEEEADLLDDVPGRHDQGGWSQARYQRHIDEHRQRHLKRVADVLFRYFKRRRFDHLILGGPEELVVEFERELHDWLGRRVRARVSVPITAAADEVLARSLAVEEQLEREKERAAVETLRAEAAAQRQAVAGLESTLRALSDGRVGRLVVASDLEHPGVVCPGCGRLASGGRTCDRCGAKLEAVQDVVEAAVAHAFRQGSRVEIVAEDGGLAELGGIGALLRF